ncbi:MAG: glycosyltransferase [Sulfuricella sp.]|jgi:glycosyltransferase involved in cell wall biosynthesis
MKILVSAFACAPNAGSEGGVGWRWAEEWAREHEVVVITDTTRRAAIEAHLLNHPLNNPRFVYFRPWWLRWMPLNSLTAQVLYQLWQIALLPYVRQLHGVEPFDLAHHVSYGVFRQPSLIGHAGIPLVFGPVGGGEDAPWRLKQSMSLAERVREFLRSLLNRFARIDPLLRWGLKGCVLILAKTGDTARALPAGFESRTVVALEIGTLPRDGMAPRQAPAGRPLRLLFAGRLLGWKGIHLGLASIARARAAGVNVEFHVVGGGPSEGHLRRQAERLGIGEVVKWFPSIPQSEFIAKYREVDAVLFPSLHDSSGNVVMEALSFALPVICLDLGGPAEIVADESGCVVRTAGLDEAGVIAHMASAIERLARDAGEYERLSAGALARAEELAWDKQVTRIKGLALDCVSSARADAVETVAAPCK